MLRRCVRVAVVLSAIAVFFFSAIPAFGQGFATGEFNGTVVDQSGGALGGVTITVTQEATGLVRTVDTNDTGRFVLPAMQPGAYTVRAELSGFQTQTRTGIRLVIGQAITLSFTLPVGTLADQITVTGEAPLIEVTQTTLGSSLTSEDIENLPTLDRDMLSLMRMVPGLAPVLGSGEYSANGRELASNLFLVDGVYNKDNRSGGFTQVDMTIDAGHSDFVRGRRQWLRHPQYDARPFRLSGAESAAAVRAPADWRSS